MGRLNWARRSELGSVVSASVVAMDGLWYTAIQTQQINRQARTEWKLAKPGQITGRYTATVKNFGDK